LKDLLSEAVKLAEEDMMARKAVPVTQDDDVAIEIEDLRPTSVVDLDQAAAVEQEQSVGLTDEERYAARVIGIASVKYADLAMNRESDYRFSFKKMLALKGNTAPYMLYAYARIQGIRRKALLASTSSLGGAVGEVGATAPGTEGPVTAKENALDGVKFSLISVQESRLARQLLKLEDVLFDVEQSLYPNKVCRIHTCTRGDAQR